MTFEVTILGNRSASPAKNHFQTAQVLDVQGRLFLIDCGEGLQMQLLNCKISMLRIYAVFISHIHGDHTFGLFGLLSTMSMLGRKNPLPIYAPTPVEDMLRDHLRYFGKWMKFQPTVYTIPTDEPVLIYENRMITVHTIPLCHCVPTCGFLFREKMPLRNIHKHLIKQYNLTINEIVRLKSGENIILSNGIELQNTDATYMPYIPRSYAYCSDTQFSESVVEQVRDVDLLYHEATFLSDKIDFAKQSMHSTAADAAMVARRAGAKKMIIGHFSSRYSNIDAFLHEAQPIFPNTEIAEEQKTFLI